MRTLLLVICLLITSCGLVQPVQSHIEYLSTIFPNSRIIPHPEWAMVYIITDTVECQTWIVNMDEFHKNRITKIIPHNYEHQK